jgi:hypothetical protein
MNAVGGIHCAGGCARAGRERALERLPEVEELLRTISSLPAGHILVILDSCHSGMALGSKF